MPIDKYYAGNGREVLGKMVSQYGRKKGEQVFYATANKAKKNLGKPPKRVNPRRRKPPEPTTRKYF